MDIFAIAEEGLEIQKKEKQIALEIEEEAKKKVYKLDIHQVLTAIAQKDYGWLGRDDSNDGGYTIDEKRKGLDPFVMNLWVAQIGLKGKKRALTNNDKVYAMILQEWNNIVNPTIFTAPKDMLWLLACKANEFELPAFSFDWVKSSKKEKAERYDARVIKYMATELWSSKEKIQSMIEDGLITSEEMKAIAKDLDTLEDPKKKKKK